VPWAISSAAKAAEAAYSAGMATDPTEPDPRRLAEAVRRACIEAALAAYEDAGVQGLCAEGRWEVAVGAMQSLDVAPLVSKAAKPVAGA
jgi:hypothetical protein